MPAAAELVVEAAGSGFGGECCGQVGGEGDVARVVVALDGDVELVAGVIPARLGPPVTG